VEATETSFLPDLYQAVADQKAAVEAPGDGLAGVALGVDVEVRFGRVARIADPPENGPGGHAVTP
jgi:hypothetical protein